MLPVWHWLQLVITPAGVIWWLPWRAQPVLEWVQEVVVKLAVTEWQFVQFTAAKVVPAAECTGLFVLL